MRIKIEKFANINNVDIEFSNQMNILIVNYFQLEI